MKKLYNEFFYIPKYGKVKEKVMLMRTALTVVIMVVCLFAMSFTAYAYFSHNVTSGFNIIKAAHFEAQVTVNNDAIAFTKDGKYQTATLPAGEYTIKLECGSSTADTGFCVITIGDAVYHTGQIGEDVAKSVDGASVIFTLRLSTDTNIRILSHWGTSSKYGYGDEDNVSKYISDGATLDLRVPDMSTGNSGTDKNDETGEQTVYTETDPVELTHTVISGDTLWEIAKKYDTSVDALKSYNGLSTNTIIPGKILKIPPEDYVIPETTTNPETTQSETFGTTESQTTPEPSTSAVQTNPEETTGVTSEQETQPAEETTGAPDTEETGGTI